VDRGERVDAVMTSLGKALFWKDKPRIQAMLSKWRSEDIATVAGRLGALERSLIFSPAPETEVLGEELIAIARKARTL
jgi:DNA polymerase-3 subunit delta